MSWIAVIGDRTPGHEPQDAIAPAIAHAALHLGVDPPDVEWISTDALEAHAGQQLHGASGAWCAPGGPFRSMSGALAGIRVARESSIPFLGTCAGFQLGVVEFARNVLGHPTAGHPEYTDCDEDARLFIDALECSLVGTTMELTIVDDEVAGLYGTRTPIEQYYCRFGLRPEWQRAVDCAGLRIAGIEASDGDVRILRLVRHPFFVLTLFVPQVSSRPGEPHPLIRRLVAAASANGH